MDKFTISDVINSTDASAYNIKGDITFDNIVIDNRDVNENSLFVAIKGDRFDGHDFINDAVDRGAKAVVSEKHVGSVPYCLVSDTRAALLDMAHFNRRRFKGVVIGITGSVGKTTTKEMIASVLSTDKKVLKTKGNLNNAIGLSKTIYGLSSDYDIAVVEMGMSGLGEISALSQCTEPTISVITNIGYSHLENLKTRQNILRAKLEILDGMNGNGPLLINADNDILKNLDIVDRKVIKCGIDGENLDYRATDINYYDDHITFNVEHKGNKEQINLPALGKHNIYNALFSFVIAKLCGIENDKIIKGINNFKPEGYRQKIIEKDDVKYILDCYNASFDSTKAAIETLSGIKTDGRKIFVFGDMLELGDYAHKLHKEVGNLIKESNIDKVFCVGNLSKITSNEVSTLKETEFFDSKNELKSRLENIIKSGDTVLFKASRALELETVALDLIEEK